MPLLRLIGLVLFITAILLGFAAAMTQTTHIRLKRPGHASVDSDPSSQATSPQDSGLASGSGPNRLPQVEFISIPILWPLMVAGGLGLLLWFGSAGLPASHSASNRRRRRR